MTTERSLQPYEKPADTVSVDELRQRELSTLIVEQGQDRASTNYASIADYLNEGEVGSIDLLDPIVAQQAEAYRQRTAGPRRRITADDLEKLL